LKKFLVLPNGIPSHDTFARVFARLEPEQLQQCFLSWMRAVSNLGQAEVIASTVKPYVTPTTKEALEGRFTW
jgi:ABC-type sulfate transport system permease component